MKKAHFALSGFLPYRMSVATNLVSEAVARAYEDEHGLTVNEWRVLAALAEQTKATQQAVSVATRMDKMTVSRATSALTARGFVARAATPHDGRANVLALTPAGEKVYAAIVPAVVEVERRVFAALSADERRQLVRLLERVEGAAVAELEGERT